MGNDTKIADAGAAGWIANSIVCFMAWAYLCGFVDSKALLPMALVSFGCTIQGCGKAQGRGRKKVAVGQIGFDW